MEAILLIVNIGVFCVSCAVLRSPNFGGHTFWWSNFKNMQENQINIIYYF